MVASPHYVRIPHPQSGRLTKQQFYPFYLGKQACPPCFQVGKCGLRRRALLLL